MSAMPGLLVSLAGLTQRLAPLLWAISWQAGVLIALVALVALLSRRASAAFRYGLWCIVLVRLCLPLSLTLPLGLAQWARQVAQTALAGQRAPAPVVPPTVGRAQEAPDPLAQMFPTEPPANPAGKAQGVSARPDFNPLVLGWGLIAAVLGLVLAWRTRRVHRLVADLPPIERPELLALFNDLCERFHLRRPVELRGAAPELERGGPMVIGVRRPVIVLPRLMADEWPLEELEPVLAHELAHVRRRDLLVNWLQIVLQIVYFFHPLVWLVNWQLRREREWICDDLAVAQLGGRRAAYSRSILRVIEETQSNNTLAAAVGMAERRSFLGRRIVRIMDRDYKFHRKMGIWSFAIMIALGCLCIVFASERSKAGNPPTSTSPAISPLPDPPLDPKIRALGEEVKKRMDNYCADTTVTLRDGQSVKIKLKDNPDQVAELQLTAHFKPQGTSIELMGLDAQGQPMADQPLPSGVLHDGSKCNTGFIVRNDNKFYPFVRLILGSRVNGQLPCEVKVRIAVPPTPKELEAMLLIRGKEGRMNVDWMKIARAVLEYKLQNGAYPTSFAQLKLAEMPYDVYSPTHAPYHYEVRPDRFVIASCGENGIYGDGDDQMFVGYKNGASGGKRSEGFPDRLDVEVDSSKDEPQETTGPTHHRPKGNSLIAGKVLDELTGQPVAGARMYLYYIDSLDALFVNTGPDGAFSFKEIPAGQYSLEASLGGYQTQRYNPENNQMQLRNFKLKDKEERRDVVFKLKRAYSVKGRVLDEAGLPFAGGTGNWVLAWVKSKPDEGYGAGWHIQSQVSIGPNGSYAFDNLDGRPVYITALDFEAEEKDNPYPMRYYPGTFSRAEAKLFNFNDKPAYEGIDIQLAKKGGLELEGTIQDETGAPIAKALVVAHRQDMLFDRMTAYSDAQGHYRMDGLGPGELEVQVDATPSNFVLTHKPLTLKNGPARLDFTLHKGVTISGKFVDEQGKDLALVGSNTFGNVLTKDKTQNQPGGTFSGVNNRYGPARDGNKSCFYALGEGDYANVSMFFPTASTFMVQGAMAGEEMLNFMPYTPGKQVLMIYYQGKDVLQTGILARAGDKIEDVEIVVGTPPGNKPPAAQ